MRRRPRRGAALVAAVACTVGGAFLLVSGHPAGAVSPDRTAWWNEAPLGVLPLSAQVGADEMAISQGAGSAYAIGAVAYSLGQSDSSDPGQAGATLTLPVDTANSVGTPAVMACPVKPSSLDWQAKPDQPASSAPSYSCASGAGVAGTVSPDGNAIIFPLTPAQQVAGHPGQFNLALVPDPSSGTPFQAVVHNPSDSDFAVSNPPQSAEPAPTTAAAPATGGSAQAAPAAPSPAPGPAAQVPFDSGSLALPQESAPALPSTPGAPASSAPTTAPATAGQSAGTPAVAKAPGGLLGGRRQQLLGVWLLVDAGLALLLFGGDSERLPRLLGPMGSRTADEPGPATVQTGGIGRFARPRTGPPRRI